MTPASMPDRSWRAWEDALDGDVEREGEGEFQTAEVLASIPQGRQLRDDAERLKWRPNHKFKGKLILASEGSKPVTLDGGLKLTVIGPMQPELMALQEAHDKWLREQKDKKKKSAESALAAYLDESVAKLVEHRRARRARRQEHAADRRRTRRQDP